MISMWWLLLLIPAVCIGLFVALILLAMLLYRKY